MLRNILSAVLFLCIALSGYTDDSAERDPLLFDLGLRLFGADIGLGFRGLTQVPNPDTVIWLYVGGGYEWLNYFRDPSNRLYSGDEGFNPSTDPYYRRCNARLDLGIAQGFIFNNKLQINLLQAFLFYKTRVDYIIPDSSKNELIIASALPDAPGIFENSFLFGLDYNDLDKTSPHRLFSGFYVEATVNWGPEWLWNDLYGMADFVQLNATAKAFLPLFDIDPKTKLNILSGYIGLFFSVDYCTGRYLPINIQQIFGGLHPRYGLGYAVRGYEDTRFDGQFKSVLNIEYRMNLPAFKIIYSFTPGVFVFFDSGYYNFCYYPKDGFLFSTGIGVYLNIWNWTSLTLYTAFPLSQPLADGSGYWLPIAIEFNAHF